MGIGVEAMIHAVKVTEEILKANWAQNVVVRSSMRDEEMIDGYFVRDFSVNGPTFFVSRDEFHEMYAWKDQAAGTLNEWAEVEQIPAVPATPDPVKRHMPMLRACFPDQSRMQMIDRGMFAIPCQKCGALVVVGNPGIAGTEDDPCILHAKFHERVEPLISEGQLENKIDMLIDFVEEHLGILYPWQREILKIVYNEIRPI